MIQLPPIPGATFSKSADYATLAGTWTGTKAVVGTSEDGQDVYALTVGDTTAKPVVFIVGGLHGLHEWRCPHYIARFMALLANPSGPAARILHKIKANIAVYAIPCANPYGYDNNFYGNFNDVNLNRNFDHEWEAYDDSVEDGLTKGTSAFSEAETQIVRDRVQALDPIMFIDVHTWGGFSGVAIERAVRNQDTLTRDLARSLTLTTGYAPTLGEQGGLPMSGEWAGGEVGSNGRNILSITPEPGENETEEVQDYLGVNILMLACLYAFTNYRTGQQTIRPDDLYR